MWRGLQGGYPDPPQKIFEQPETPVKKDHPHVARLTTGQSQLIAFLLLHDLAERLPGRAAGPATEMPMPILDEITQPDPAGMGEVLNRNDYHTLDAKDHDGSMSHLGHKRRSRDDRLRSALPPSSDATIGCFLRARWNTVAPEFAFS
jgi:hypothetical protein